MEYIWIFILGALLSKFCGGAIIVFFIHVCCWKTFRIILLFFQAFTPQKLEVMRNQVLSEIEVTYRQKYMKQEEEAKEAWGTVSKLRYELSFLKSEYEHDKAEHARQMQDLKMQTDLEVS